MKCLTVVLCLLLSVPVMSAEFKEDIAVVEPFADPVQTYWRVDESGEMVQTTQAYHQRQEVMVEIKEHYAPLMLGIVGVFSATTVGMVLGLYLVYTASGN